MYSGRGTIVILWILRIWNFAWAAAEVQLNHKFILRKFNFRLLRTMTVTAMFASLEVWMLMFKILFFAQKSQIRHLVILNSVPRGIVFQINNFNYMDDCNTKMKPMQKKHHLWKIQSSDYVQDVITLWRPQWDPCFARLANLVLVKNKQMKTYIYMYIYRERYIHIYISVYIHRKREREREKQICIKFLARASHARLIRFIYF